MGRGVQSRGFFKCMIQAYKFQEKYKKIMEFFQGGVNFLSDFRKVTCFCMWKTTGIREFKKDYLR